LVFRQIDDGFDGFSRLWAVLPTSGANQVGGTLGDVGNISFPKISQRREPKLLQAGNHGWPNTLQGQQRLPFFSREAHLIILSDLEN
jgi:hypothetical protein